MRVCFVAYFNEQNGKGDIGTKNVALHLADEASKRHEVLKVDVRNLGSWNKVKAFRPDIIHFVFSPTAIGFIAARAFNLYCRGTKVVMSAPNPTLSCKWLIKYLRPDIILTQAQESEQFFQDIGFVTKFLPNGVDVDRFVPVSPEQKEKLRKKYKIDIKKFVMLHVGSITLKRSIKQLLELQNEDCQLLVIGRRPYDSQLLTKLQANGVIVITEYVEKIEEIYGLSDCYIFPTNPGNRGACIEMPLSVEEAMACNLPVLSTKFLALPRVFKEHAGFLFFENLEELKNKISLIKNKTLEINTRESVSSLSWSILGQKQEQIYCELFKSDKKSCEMIL